jgi:hypothetical protein
MQCATGQSAVGWCGQARVSRGAWVCVLSLKPLGLPGAASFLCVVLLRLFGTLSRVCSDFHQKALAYVKAMSCDDKYPAGRSGLACTASTKRQQQANEEYHKKEEEQAMRRTQH